MYKPFWVLAQLPQSKLQTLRQSQVLTCTLRRDLRTCCPRSPSYQLGQGWRLEGETSSKSPQGQSHPVLDDSRFEGYCRLSGHLELFVQMLPIMCLKEPGRGLVCHCLRCERLTWFFSGPGLVFRARFAIPLFGQLAV